MYEATVNEAVISQLIANGQLDETNPHVIRSYQAKAQEIFGIDEISFYTERHAVLAAGLDEIIERLFG